jgi:hypothetical protein
VHLLAKAALWTLDSNPDFSQKYKMGDTAKEWPTNSSTPKKSNSEKKVHILIIMTEG